MFHATSKHEFLICFSDVFEFVERGVCTGFSKFLGKVSVLINFNYDCGYYIIFSLCDT
jgi:hypothetical protein